MLISRISEIDHINDLEKEFEVKYGMRPVNVSSWHISEKFREKMLRCMELPTFGNSLEYYYTYSITQNIQDAVLEKLGTQDQCAAITITPNNTISIVNIANLLRLSGRRNICVVNPAYFSVCQTFATMGLHYATELMHRNKNGYQIPYDEILTQKYDVVWLTSPVFSTGVYLTDEDISKIYSLMEHDVFVVADESFSLKGHELIRRVGIQPNFIGIYSPHKAISCNSFKFSAIVSHSMYEDILEHWIDVLCGNLPQSTCGAVLHFVSDNYDICLQEFMNLVDNARHRASSLLYGQKHDTDQMAIGSMQTIYFNRISNNIIDDDFFRNLYQKTYAGFLPGILNGFDSSYGLCFRVNLALDCPEFQQALHRLVFYLDLL